MSEVNNLLSLALYQCEKLREVVKGDYQDSLGIGRLVGRRPPRDPVLKESRWGKAPRAIRLVSRWKNSGIFSRVAWKAANELNPDYLGIQAVNALRDAHDDLLDSVTFDTQDLPAREFKAHCIATNRLRDHVAERAAQTDAAEEAMTLMQVLELLDPDLCKIIGIASKRSLTADQRMTEIATINPAACQWKAPKWARILDCTEQNVRKTPFYKERARSIANGDD